MPVSNVPSVEHDSGHLLMMETNKYYPKICMLCMAEQLEIFFFCSGEMFCVNADGFSCALHPETHGMQLAIYYLQRFKVFSSCKRLYS